MIENTVVNKTSIRKRTFKLKFWTIVAVGSSGSMYNTKLVSRSDESVKSLDNYEILWTDDPYDNLLLFNSEAEAAVDLTKAMKALVFTEFVKGEVVSAESVHIAEVITEYTEEIDTITNINKKQTITTIKE
jgi:hypothetical protein